jgi:hypothetical protein
MAGKKASSIKGEASKVKPGDITEADLWSYGGFLESGDLTDYNQDWTKPPSPASRKRLKGVFLLLEKNTIRGRKFDIFEGSDSISSLVKYLSVTPKVKTHPYIYSTEEDTLELLFSRVIFPGAQRITKKLLKEWEEEKTEPKSSRRKKHAKKV